MKVSLMLLIGLVISLSAVSANSSKKTTAPSSDEIQQQMEQKLQMVNEIMARRHVRQVQVQR